jgi:broad specificity phosphatase PhoE
VSDIVKDYAHNYHTLDNIPTVEKLEDLQKRAAAELERIKQMPQDTILIVGHAAFGRALRRVVAGRPYTDEYTSGFNQIPNAQLFKMN